MGLRAAVTLGHSYHSVGGGIFAIRATSALPATFSKLSRLAIGQVLFKPTRLSPGSASSYFHAAWCPHRVTSMPDGMVLSRSGAHARLAFIRRSLSAPWQQA